MVTTVHVCSKCKRANVSKYRADRCHPVERKERCDACHKIWGSVADAEACERTDAELRVI